MESEKKAASSLAGGEGCDLSDAIDQFIGDAIANGAIEINGDDTIQWCKPALKQTLVSSLAGCGYHIAALSPEVPARERVTDLVQRIKYQVECSSGNLIKSGADSDMVRICLSHFNDLADEVGAFTPRHEAPASEGDA